MRPVHASDLSGTSYTQMPTTLVTACLAVAKRRGRLIGSLFLFAGAAYFVFSETLDVYSGKDERLKRFQDAAIQFIGSLEMIIRSPPLYKLWPTKPYRQYLQRVYAVQDIGKCHVQTLMVPSCSKKYDGMLPIEVFLTVC